MRNIIKLALVGLLSVSTIAVAAESSPEALRIGYQKGSIGMVLAKSHQLLEKRYPQSKISWVEFPAGPQMLEALNVGSIDLGSTGDIPPIFAQAAGADLVYVGVEPPKPKAEVILVAENSPIKTVADLKGHKVAFQKGSSSHNLLLRALRQAGLKFTDIQPTYLTPADARAAFQQGNVDAWAIWDPYYSAALLQCGVRVLKDGTDLNQTGSFYLAARPYAEKNGAFIQGVLATFSEADALTRSQREQSIALLAKTMGLPAPVIASYLDHRPPTTIKPVNAEVAALQQQTADLFYENRLVPKKVDIRQRIGRKTIMSLNMFWFLPTHGDGHYLGTEEGSRPVDHGYLQQIAQAADRLGYTGVLIPTGRSCEDAWLVAASMIPVTQRLKFLVALRPSVTSPTVAARQAATLDRLSNGRALFNLVTGSDPQELAGDGVFLDHSERYEASAEFTQVWRRLLLGETVNFNGKHIHVRGAKLLFPPIQQPYPPLYFGGSSDVAQELAAEQVDLYLTWGEPPELVKEKIEQVRAKAAAHGRKIRFGIRLHVIVRETNDEAWQAAERLISHLDDETIAKAQAAFARTDSVGQQRMAALHNGKRDNLEISPNLWAGVGLVRGGAGTALVGDGPTVAARINEYAALGIDSFVLSGYPHLEEAYRVGELLFPHLDVAIPEIPQPQPLNPQGEAVANDFIPRKVAQS